MTVGASYTLKTCTPDAASGDYAAKIDKLRIIREPDFGDCLPWQLDGVVFSPDGITNYTAAVLNFQTHAEAVAAVPEFLGMLVRDGVDVSSVVPA